MVRKSRKLQNSDEVLPCFVGGYVRLSVVDSGTKKEDTIENQKAMIMEFINQRPDMKFFDLYCDVGGAGGLNILISKVIIY